MPVDIILCIVLGIMAVQNILWRKERKNYIRMILSGSRHFPDENTKPIKNAVPKYKKVMKEWHGRKESD